MVSAFVCVDARDWEAVVRGVAGYLAEGEAVLAHVLDERGPRGYELALRGLLGRRGRGAARGMNVTSREAAETLLADAEALLARLCPRVSVSRVLLSGPPNEELVRAVGEAGSLTVFVGRGAPGARPVSTVRGTVSGWMQNPGGETDALVLEDGTRVRFPPHRAGAVREVAREGGTVEATGSWQADSLHAYVIVDPNSGGRAEAHKPLEKAPGKSPLGHTARFVVDHATCDVVVLSL